MYFIKIEDPLVIPGSILSKDRGPLIIPGSILSNGRGLVPQSYQAAYLLMREDPSIIPGSILDTERILQSYQAVCHIQMDS